MGGIYFFYLLPPPKIYFFIFLIIIAFYRKVRLTDVNVLVLISIVVFIFFAQRTISERGSLYNLLGNLIPILNAYLIIKILGKRFFRFFVNIVYAFAIIGLVFWLAENLIPAFNNSIPHLAARFGTDPGGLDESLILFAYEPNREFGDLIIRNNGGFWEPGAYVTTLIPALFFCYTLNGIKNIKSLVILLAIITTFSTTGYLALFVLIIYFILLSSYKLSSKVGLIILALFITSFSYYSLDFLSAKIEENITFVNQSDLATGSDGRFLALKKAIYSVGQHPLLGKDFIPHRGEEIDYYAKDWVGYGWMDLMAKIGLVFFSLYLIINYNFYKRFVKANGRGINYWLLALLPFLAQYIVLFGQALYAVPLFLVILVFPLTYKKQTAYELQY